MTNLLHRNDKFLTVQNKCPTIPPSTSMHFASPVQRSRVVRLSWSSRFLMWVAVSKLQASNLSRVSTFILWTSPFIEPHKQKSDRVRYGDSTSCITVIHVLIWTLFPHNDRYYHLQHIDLSFWTTLYIQPPIINRQTQHLFIKIHN